MTTYIGNATDFETREIATSGGIGSSILKYLFESNVIGTAITLDFSKENLCYQPRLIYSYDDYKVSGSVYHEIDIISFIRQNANKIKGAFCCFVLPCQVKPVRAILNKNGVKSFLFALTCSSQQTIGATHFLLKSLKINPKEVSHIQYRGGGWPGGITISLESGGRKFIPNGNSLWTQIFHSRLFVMPRCFKCNSTISEIADISLADPWLKEYVKTETHGKTIFRVNTEFGNGILKQALSAKFVQAVEVDDTLFEKSQASTIKRKELYKRKKGQFSRYHKFINARLYRSVFLSNLLFFKLHFRLKTKVERFLMKNA